MEKLSPSSVESENALRQARCFVGCGVGLYRMYIYGVYMTLGPSTYETIQSSHMCCVYLREREREREQVIHDRADIAPCDIYILHLCLSMSLCLSVSLSGSYSRAIFRILPYGDTEAARFRFRDFI